VTRVLHERSAGGVLLVPLGEALLVALIELRAGTVLALPKGHIEPGERPEEAARRETREETGLVGRTIAPLKEISYHFYSRHQRARIVKRVAFFLLIYRAGSPARHNAEVEGVRFVPLHQAASRMAYSGEREVVRAAEAAVGPPRPALLETGSPLCSH
jgi:8-oxo-dGTP pyrophosphatase MutT (NUDIX family)